ncbi:MAG: type II toxin-antitoxin system RelE/ParE family toxin [Candidatus Aminicenantes bacterium]|jgi:toxin YoeB|nr:type II toxin-antitoxin system RelE/ParE family toxin [Candidatus Aminicenantes bacterium]
MAKQVKWSKAAVTDRIEILDYWFLETGNKKYSKKLDKAFRETISLLSKFPEMGRVLEGREERYFVKENYRIFYLIKNDSIEILRIWDSRRNPEDLNI